MEILGHGIDIVSIARFREVLTRQGDAFCQRVFSPEEIRYCQDKSDPVPHFAARFAAKEAFSKAVGVGIGKSGALGGVSVIHAKEGAPELVLSGNAEQVLQTMGGKRCFLSLTHDGDSALASVIIWGEV